MELIIRNGKIANYDYIEREKVEKALDSDIEYLNDLKEELEKYQNMNLIKDIEQYNSLHDKLTKKIKNIRSFEKTSEVPKINDHSKTKTLLPLRNNTSLLSNRRGAITVGILISSILMTVVMMMVLFVALYLRQQ